MNEKTTKYLSIITEFGVYCYLFCLFFDKGQTVRDIGLYSSLFCFILLSFVFKKIKFSLNIIDYAFLFFIFSIILSSFFSIEPSVSFTYFEKDVIKNLAIFFIIGKFFDTKRLFRLVKLICISGVFILISGLHGFINSPEKIYTSNNVFLSVNRNEYAFFLTIYLPLFLLFIVKNNKLYQKIIYYFLFFWTLCALILTGSRASIVAGIFCIFCFVLILTFDKKYRKTIKNIVIFCSILVFILYVAIFTNISNFQSIRNHFLSTPDQIKTFNLRTTCFWIPSIEAVKKKPLIGWGYGGKIARDPRPFANTQKICLQFKGGFHNTFISILFHQGLIGFISFIFLLLTSLIMLIKIAKNKDEEKKLIAISLFSLVAGSFVVNSIALSVAISRVFPFIGIVSSIIRKTQDEDSNN